MDKETIMQLVADGVISNEVAERYFPELKESEDEIIRKEILDYIDKSTGCKRWIDWLEKQGEQKHCMIQWKGDNLKEVIDFTGKDKNFEKWFKSFEEYEKYVQEHDGIFKLFNADGSHCEVPVGAWIVKTPDGYNVASKAIFRQKSVEWSEEDVDVMDTLIKYLTQECDKTTIPEDKEMFDREISMLKSLKGRVQPQNTWKPSDKQMNILSIYAHVHDVLASLYQDLKKLKE